MIRDRCKESPCIRTLVWIVLVIFYCSYSIGKVVVEFKSDTSHDHLVLDVEFANMDSLGNQELALIENGFTGSLEYAVSISQIVNDSRIVSWRGQVLPSLTYKILVGNIDGDEQDEVIVYRVSDSLFDSISPDTVRLIQFENDKCQETLYTSIEGKYGALIDVNNDGRSEVILIEDIGPPLFDDAREPSGIRLYSFDGDEFILLGELDLEHTIRCFTVGDVDADGKPEIATQETSNDGEILHQISIYDVSSTGEITHQFSKNRVLTFSLFPTRLREMRVFTDDTSNTYV